MIYLDLLIGFLKVGCFAFGGAYGAIPLIRDVVMSYGWLSDEMFTYMVAVSESTPGPIMVNLATYIGSQQGGFLGAVLATGVYMILKNCLLKNGVFSPDIITIAITAALFVVSYGYKKMKKKQLRL